MVSKKYIPASWKSDVDGTPGIVMFKFQFSDATGHLELFDGKNILNYDDEKGHHDYTEMHPDFILAIKMKTLC